MEKIKNLLSFDTFITPVIIKAIYYIGVVLVVIMGLFQIVTSFSYYGGIGVFISGLLTIVLGPFLVKIYCELLIIIFKIHKELTEINTKLSNNDEEAIS
ncbi:MAG: DUF4282 domain-containing protein [Eubacteriaceae bacterium]